MRHIIILILILGIGGLVYSLTIAPYTDEDLAKKLYETYINYSEEYLNELEYVTDYDNEYQKLKTPRFKLMDISLGFIFFSLSLLMYMIKKRVYRFNDFRKIETTSRNRLIAQAILIWLLIIPLFKFNMDFMYYRKDSLHDIDAYVRTLLYISGKLLLIWIPLIAFVLIMSNKSKHPTLIFSKFKAKKSTVVFVELIAWSLVLILLIGTIGLIYTGLFLIIPILLYYIHIFLSLRAGRLKGLIKN